MAAGAATVATGRLRLLGFHRALRRRFGPVDAIVHGHLHLPLAATRSGVLFFSPGAVYVPEDDPGYGSGPGARAHLRFRRRQGDAARAPAVGRLDLGPDGIVAWVLPLDPDRPPWEAARL